ncbi:MAG TPA: hypothetical protein K8U70_00580 [Facklamia tabacinasalis]|nr:hypothetical protein FOB80_09595 [Aerococcus viridans]HJG47362.1 hypothetical protein [Ruoffia tabacinasalis]
MKLTEYAWNDHERQLKADGLEKIPSPYKVKIVDVLAKRTQLEEAFAQLSQADLAKWAILNAERFIQDIDINDSQKKIKIITATKAMLLKRIDGQASAYELRQAGFLANTLAKEAVSETSKFAGRVFAQAIATGHMRGHAIVSADYAIKVVNLKYPNDIDAIIAERKQQIQLVSKI